jgi:chemotaxis response regulator CheB
MAGGRTRAQRELPVGLLSADGMVVAGAVGDGYEAVSAAQRLRPDAGMLFESVAEVYGRRAQRAAGSPTLAQDEASCVVYGMPCAAIETRARCSGLSH